MAVKAYTEEELRRIAVAKFRYYIDDADVSPFSDYDLQARVLAAIASGSQAHAQALGRQIFPLDCDEAELAKHGEARGLSYLAPTKARGYIGIEGAAGDLLPVGSTFDGGTYVSIADATCAAAGFTPVTVAEGSGRERLIVSSTSGMSAGMLIAVGTETAIIGAIPAGGIIDLLLPLETVAFVGSLVSGVAGALVEVEAVATGSRYNSTISRDSNIDSVPSGTSINRSAHRSRITGGGDAEQAREYRARIVDFDAGRAASTNAEAVRTLTKAYPDLRIAEAFVFPNFRYPGALAVVAYGAPGARELAPDALEDVGAFLLAALGSEVDLTVYPIAFDGTPADIDLEITAGTGYEPDWGTSSSNAFVIGAGSDIGRVNLTTSPVGVIPVGARVLVPIVLGDVYRTEQRQVRAVDATGIDLATDLSGEPSTGGEVTSGSPATQRIIDQITASFEALGPGTYVASATKDRLRWPSPSTTGGAVVSGTRILNAAGSVEGVLVVDWTSGSFTTRTPAALETIRLGILTLRHVYP